jgi:hypothetical protein
MACGNSSKNCRRGPPASSAGVPSYSTIRTWRGVNAAAYVFVTICPYWYSLIEGFPFAHAPDA